MKTIENGKEVTWEGTGERTESPDEHYYCEFVVGYVDGKPTYQGVGHYLIGPEDLEEISDVEEIPGIRFGKQTQQWFLDRVGQKITAKSSAFNGEMEVKDESHAKYLCNVAQETQGYQFKQ